MRLYIVRNTKEFSQNSGGRDGVLRLFVQEGERRHLNLQYNYYVPILLHIDLHT